MQVFEISPAIFFISGQDAERYLHGRLTQDIKGLKTGSAARSLLLTPQGKILAQFYVLRQASGFLLVSDPFSSTHSEADFLADLLQFKVADDVQVLPLSTNRQIFRVAAERTEEFIAELFSRGLLPAPECPKETGSFLQLAEGAFLIKLAFGNQLVLDFVLSPQQGDLSKSLASLKADSAAYSLFRIRAKYPLFSVDLNNSVLAPEIDLSAVLSFNKGCYVGQEVVEMATARGRPNRRLALLEQIEESSIAAHSEELTSGTPLRLVGDYSKKESEKEVGMLSSVAEDASSGKCFCLAFIKNTVSEDALLKAGEYVFKQT